MLIVIPLRFERKTHALEGRCSIQLSYGTILICGCKGSAFVEYQKLLADFLFVFFFLVMNQLFIEYKYWVSSIYGRIIK